MVSYAAIIQALEEAGASDPNVRKSIGLYIDLLKLESGVDAGSSRSALSASDIAHHVQSDKPLLEADAWGVESAILAPLCVEVAHKTAQHRRELAESLAAIAAWFAAHREALGSTVADYLNGGCCQDALASDIDAGLHRFVLAHGVHPFLRVEAEALTPLIDMPRWFRGLCPVCGGVPDMAALEREDGGRRLLCSRCDAEWPFYRTTCPFCGDEAHTGYSMTKPGYRLYACDTCKQYIKTVDRRETLTARPLPAERILTLDMDSAAQAAGWGAEAVPQQG